MFRAVQPVINLLEIFTRNSQSPWISALAGSQHHAEGVVALARSHDLKTSIPLSPNGFHAFFHMHREAAFANGLVPAVNQVLLARAVQPQLAFGRTAVGFRS